MRVAYEIRVEIEHLSVNLSSLYFSGRAMDWAGSRKYHNSFVNVERVPAIINTTVFILYGNHIKIGNRF